MTGKATYIKASVVMFDDYTDDPYLKLFVVSVDSGEEEELPNHPFIGELFVSIDLAGIYGQTAFFFYSYTDAEGRKTAVTSFNNELQEWAVVIHDIEAHVGLNTGETFSFGSFRGFSSTSESPSVYISDTISNTVSIFRCGVEDLSVEKLGDYPWYTTVVNDSWISASPSMYLTGDPSKQEWLYTPTHATVGFSPDLRYILMDWVPPK